MYTFRREVIFVFFLLPNYADSEIARNGDRLEIRHYYYDVPVFIDSSAICFFFRNSPNFELYTEINFPRCSVGESKSLETTFSPITYFNVVAQL